MSGMRMDFMAAQVPEYQGFGVRLWVRYPDVHQVVTDVVLTASEVGPNMNIKPAMELHPDEAQSLMDALWYAGVRPSNGEGSTGQLAATERHLADMQRLVFARVKAPTTK